MLDRATHGKQALSSPTPPSEEAAFFAVPAAELYRRRRIECDCMPMTGPWAPSVACDSGGRQETESAHDGRGMRQKGWPAGSARRSSRTVTPGRRRPAHARPFAAPTARGGLWSAWCTPGIAAGSRGASRRSRAPRRGPGAPPRPRRPAQGWTAGRLVVRRVGRCGGGELLGGSGWQVPVHAGPGDPGFGDDLGDGVVGVA